MHTSHTDDRFAALASASPRSEIRELLGSQPRDLQYGLIEGQPALREQSLAWIGGRSAWRNDCPAC